MKHLRRSLIVVLLLCSIPTAADAQTLGRISVGASVTHNDTPDDGVRSATGIGPLVRLNPRRGWGPAGAFNWFSANLDDPSGDGGAFARLRVRPLMGGVAYTLGRRMVLVSFSIVTGPSFNQARFRGSHGVFESIDADNSWALRPGVGVTWTVAPRVAVVAFGGYMINRPGVVYRDSVGTTVSGHWKADSLVTSVGVVYSVF